MLELFAPAEVFCVYAHEDEASLRKVEKHLSLLERQGLISLWHDRLIAPGSDRTATIDAHLANASVILLFISADFFASDYCYSIAMQHALQRHQNNQARVIPILLRPVDWQGSPFTQLQPLPTNARPITTWHNKDAALADVVAGIRQKIEEMVGFSAHFSPSALPSLWNVPYPRNPFFTGRQDLLEELRDKLTAVRTAALTQRQAISGLGGIGKTQIALEYAYQYRNFYRFIFWVRAAERETFISDFVSIAGLLNLPGKDESDQNQVVREVKQWFTMHQDWLLILDNADDVAMVSTFIPTDGNGHLLLTSRAQALGSIAQRIDVGTVGMAEGTLFLLHRTRILAPETSLDQATDEQLVGAEAIVIAMDFLPLALDQAGAYIEEVGCNFSTYLELYQENRKKLLRRRSKLPTDHPEPVATTWSLSFEKVEQANPAAAHLLRLCAFLEPDFIPEELIGEGCAHFRSVLGRVAKQPLALNDAIEELRKFSLIKRHAATKTLSIHRLVQAVLRDAMHRGTQHRWAERAVLATYTVFPEVVEVETGVYSQRYLSQAQSSVSLIQEYAITKVEAIHLLNRTGLYLSHHALYKQAEALYLQAIAIAEQSLDTDDPNGANPRFNLANLYSDQGKYVEAESFYKQVAHSWEQRFGPEHPDVASVLNELGSLYREQGRYAEAEELYKRALHIRERSLAPEHLDIASSFHNLANLYRKQGRYAEAEELYRRALHIREQSLGPEHPHILSLIHNLALISHEQGRERESELLYQRALQAYERTLGPEHPDLALAMSGLATLYNDQGRYTEAESLYQRVLHLRQQSLGSRHPDVASLLYNLALLCKRQRRYTEAETCYQQSLHIWEQILGPDQFDLTYPLIGLADLYQSQGKYAEAEPLYQRVLHIQEQVLGPEHPDVADSLHNLALLYIDQKKYEEAETSGQRALNIREQHSGATHPDTAASLDVLAILYSNQGKYQQAEPLYQRALDILTQYLGVQHPDTLVVVHDIAVFQEAQGNRDEALASYKSVLALREHVLGLSHPQTNETRDRYQSLLQEIGPFDEPPPS